MNKSNFFETGSGFREPEVNAIGGRLQVPCLSLLLLLALLLLPTVLKITLRRVDERSMEPQGIERRASRGVCVRANVTVKVLAAFPGPSGGNSVSARLIQWSGNGMRLRLQFPVACGASVAISDGDDSVLGTVCSCIPDNGAYVIGVLLSHDRALAS